MAEFKAITTQEELDAVIGERIRRERDSMAKKYGDYDALKNKVADYEQQIGTLTQERDDNARKYAGYDKTLADLQAQIKGHETNSVKMRIAHEFGIPYEMAGRLAGKTEAEVRKDAEAMARYFEKSAELDPLKSTEPAGVSKEDAALLVLSEELTSKGD